MSLLTLALEDFSKGTFLDVLRSTSGLLRWCASPSSPCTPSSSVVSASSIQRHPADRLATRSSSYLLGRTIENSEITSLKLHRHYMSKASDIT